jgi:hydroxypyruvate isomerase
VLLFAANLSLLWASLPLEDRFERCARAGLRAAELWWPGSADAEKLPELAARWDLQIALLNFDAGDMAAGDRGLAGDPPAATSCAPTYPRRCGSPRRAATTTAGSAAFIARVDRPNVRLQYDVHHMQRTEGDLVTTMDAYWPLIGHIQIADVPGRHEPGTGEIN